MHVVHDGTTFSLQSEQRSSDVQFHRHGIPAGGDGTAAILYAGYRRCSDFDAGNHAGQDYVAVRADERTIVGVVADGVGQSFYGDLAGCRVARFLTDFLWTRRLTPPADGEIADALLDEAKSFRGDIEAFAIPSHLPAVLQEALAETKTKGSQAVFGAFIYDIEASVAHVYQVGDVDVYLIDGKGDRELLRAEKRGRWSSGGHSDLLLRVEHGRPGVAGLLAHTDGATENWATTVPLDHDADVGARFEELAQTRASVDDISFVGVTRTLTAAARATPPPRVEPQRPAADRQDVRPPLASSTPRRPMVKPAKLSWRWAVALFTAGALTAFVLTFVWEQASAAMIAVGSPPPRPRPKPPAPAPLPVRRLHVAATKYDALEKELRGFCRVRSTGVGEVSVWTIVPHAAKAEAFRLKTPVQTATVTALAADETRRAFRIELANLKAGPVQGVAELLGGDGSVLARGELTLVPRDDPPTSRGYYLLAPVAEK